MAAEQNIQVTADFLPARNIDFVGQFGNRIAGLQKILSVMNIIPLPIGSAVHTYKSSVTLAGGNVGPGELIPLSKVQFEPDKTYNLTWDKRRKSVTAEDIQTFGFETAVVKTDEKFLNELTKNLRNTLFANLKTGTGKGTGEGLQAALSQAWANLNVAFEDEDFTSVAFVNPFDAADYLGKAQITMQTVFGMNYIENFLGFDVVFISNQMTKGEIIATAAENLNLYYAPVAGSDVARAFNLTTEVNGYLGVKHSGDDDHLTYKTVVASAMLWLAEKLDGVFKVTVTSPSV